MRNRVARTNLLRLGSDTLDAIAGTAASRDKA
jgi:hypothetical protein